MAQRGKQQAAAMLDRIERAVAAAEGKTSVEFVLVFAGKSGNYADVDLRAGLILAALSLLALLFAPLEFPVWSLLYDLPVSLLLGWLASRYWPPVRRRLTTARRREAQVRERAAALMTDRGVTLTLDRTGLLIYVSWLERRAEVLADIGIERAVPRPAWNLAAAKLKQAALAADFPASFLAALDETAALLGEHLPPAGENPNEIPDRPVML
ncbi:MAG TPA: hypothetical protein PK961_02020 [bacterium]|nr:hypothetical protein [bacterium]